MNVIAEQLLCQALTLDDKGRAEISSAVRKTPRVYVFWRGRPWVAGLFLVIQVVFNIYPILHLRVVRDRLNRHFEKIRSRQGPETRAPL